ncbi:hypothetical protein [Magnetovibrio sp.]|uniref:hypothetical protein n=1 Tax=Magnetovibrio sp. TaxID=2024836 RepID=UPI002F95C065
MPIPNATDTNIGTTLTRVSAASFRFGFEQQFNQIQNTVIRRINSEIDTVIRNDDTPRRLAALERDYGKLEKNKALIDSFAFDMRANQTRLASMQTNVYEAISAFTAVDDNTNLTADEITALNAKRDALIEETSALLLSVHPDISTPYVVRDVKNMYETLKAMSPVEGVVDPAGTTTPTNGNRQILDDLNTLSGLIDTAYDVTTTTLENASQTSLNLSATLATKLSDMTQLSSIELQKREAQIEDIKANYGNILRVISLSFEARISSVEEMNKSVQGWDIPPGSVMNLFV